jgi:amino acid permease
MILASIIYCFTETLVIFFFVGTGVSVKEYTQTHNLDHQYHKRSIAIKRRVYPPLMLNLLFMIILFVLVGAVDTGRMPAWIYQIIFIGCLAHYIRIKIVQNGCFKDNTQIILDMSGIKAA